ncbi:phosphodiester glycosidase family protein [Saccharopolyspora sp. K220]|uniref:phosphodiester glycosidase family protein n=1 Tax=Saccharopolyspora soli TaxID=2926618 RepID=UPI001F55E4D5|nr:phosphodiester glycosidase family protein [Saccharopolyspora soli]MCI2416051.1 phosphodiester glycosidase family protein [Saccharopolyspora soli]
MPSAGLVRRRALGAVLLSSALLLPATSAAADELGTADEQIAPGVTYRPFSMSTVHGPVAGHLVTVDLRNPGVELDLLHPASVAARDEIADMANAQRAVAGVNGDFFHVSETHEGVAATGSSVGPEIADGEDLKAAVPNGQRFGPGLPAGTSTEDVFGVGADHSARVSSLNLTGVVRSPKLTAEVAGLNQYALPVNGIGMYTSDWGAVSRARSVCGTDTDREAPCSTDTEEVVVRDGVVSAEQDQPGSGAIAENTVVLVGRENGAAELEKLNPGDRVQVESHLVAADAPPLEFAVGGFPILRAGSPLPGLDAATLAPRTSAGVSADGKTVYLLAVDGRSAASTGMSVQEMADLMGSFGAADAVNLDGGGSTTMAVRDPGQELATVKNVPSDGLPRAVANGIGVFSTPR